MLDIIVAVYFRDHLPERESTYLVVCFMAMRRGVYNPNDTRFTDLLEQYWFDASKGQSKDQKRALASTIRRNLVKRGKYLTYSVDKRRLEVSKHWPFRQDEWSINLNIIMDAG